RNESLPFAAHSVAPMEPPAGSDAPAWVALSWSGAAVPTTLWPVPRVRRAVIDARSARVLHADGYTETFRWPSRERTDIRRVPSLMPIGRACAAFAADDWWVVDPEQGLLKSAIPHEWIPNYAWVGVTTNERGELVLAAAEQRLVVADPVGRVV